MIKKSESNKILGQKIREARESKGITLSQMAKDMDISLSFTSEIERGIKHCPDVLLTKIVCYLGLSEYEVLMDSGRIPREIINALREQPKIKQIISELSESLDEGEIEHVLDVIHRMREHKRKVI